MKKIYFAGSIRGGRDDQKVYSDMITRLSEFAKVMTEHVGLKDLNVEGESERSDHDIYQRDVNWIIEADIIVAEVSTPSLGVGYELGHAEQLGKKIICLYQKNAKHRLSAMVAGNPNIEVLVYEEVEDIIKPLEEFLKYKRPSQLPS